MGELSRQLSSAALLGDQQIWYIAPINLSVMKQKKSELAEKWEYMVKKNEDAREKSWHPWQGK